ncbi:hypothetical protein BJ875DRAFT_265954 [Amylocarpus encephaloides]|uniref:Uncharacterized protein n=1 Tax=Amylocarpus encephaloides TaxID=45428 RepID=A0A9P7YL79_9HELO|nr:hypothetical protein BJ875DRAFT_265954 [Amylocarpus encephaloides]
MLYELAGGSLVENQEDVSDDSEDEDTGDKDDEDERELRPAKRRKIILPHLPTPAHNMQLHTPPPSRSPSTSESSASAEYQEWPLSGYLKSVRIGTKINFRLDFTVVNGPVHPEQLSGLNLLRSILSTTAHCLE